MYIAMNRFKITPGREADFIEIWKNRDTHLENVAGFKEFHLLQGESNDAHTLFSSHSVWNSAEDFVNWTHSDAFKKAHSNAGESRDLYLGPPQFEGFEVVV